MDMDMEILKKYWMKSMNLAVVVMDFQIKYSLNMHICTYPALYCGLFGNSEVLRLVDIGGCSLA